MIRSQQAPRQILHKLYSSSAGAVADLSAVRQPYPSARLLSWPRASLRSSNSSLPFWAQFCHSTKRPAFSSHNPVPSVSRRANIAEGHVSMPAAGVATRDMLTASAAAHPAQALLIVSRGGSTMRIWPRSGARADICPICTSRGLRTRVQVHGE